MGSAKTTNYSYDMWLWLSTDEAVAIRLGFEYYQTSTTNSSLTGYMTKKFSFWNDLNIRETSNLWQRLYALPKRRTVVITP